MAWQQQQHQSLGIQPQLLAGFRAARKILKAIQQGVTHPGDVGSALRIELRLRREDGQDPIGEIQQPGGAAIPKAPGPFLGAM